MQLVNAFGEELLFRGAIFALLLSLPCWRAVALNALLFGSMHLIHGYMDGDWWAALHQAFFTVLGGALFAAMRYASRSLWLVILLHAGLNLSIIYSNVGPAFGPAAETALEVGPDVGPLLVEQLFAQTPPGCARTPQSRDEPRRERIFSGAWYARARRCLSPS